MMKNRKVLLGCAVALGCSLFSVNNANAWGRKKKDKKDEKVKATEISSKPVDASVANVDAPAVREIKVKYQAKDDEATQKSHEYQDACAKHKASSLAVMRARQRAEKAIACWNDAVAARDRAYSAWMLTCEDKGELYDIWLKACEEEQKLARIKDAALAELADCIRVDSENQIKEKDIYNQYLTCVAERQKIYDEWFSLSRAFSEQSASVAR